MNDGPEGLNSSALQVPEQHQIVAISMRRKKKNINERKKKIYQEADFGGRRINKQADKPSAGNKKQQQTQSLKV